MPEPEPLPNAGCSLWLFFVGLSSLSPLVAVAVAAADLGWLAAICALMVGLFLGIVNLGAWVYVIQPSLAKRLQTSKHRRATWFQLIPVVAFYVGTLLSGLLVGGLTLLVARLVQWLFS